MSEFKVTVRQLRKAKKLTQKELAEMVGVKFQSIQQWESGKTGPTVPNLKALAEALGVTVNDLASGSLTELQEGINLSGNVKSIEQNVSSKYTFIPFLSAKAQAGLTKMHVENFESQLEETYPVLIPAAILQGKHLVIEMADDSMEPSIKRGAIVLAQVVDNQDFSYESGAVYAVWYANRFVIRRIKTNDIQAKSQLTLWSDNERYGNITVLAPEIQCMWKVTRKVDELIS